MHIRTKVALYILKNHPRPIQIDELILAVYYEENNTEPDYAANALKTHIHRWNHGEGHRMNLEIYASGRGSHLGFRIRHRKNLGGLLGGQ